MMVLVGTVLASGVLWVLLGYALPDSSLWARVVVAAVPLLWLSIALVMRLAAVPPTHVDAAGGQHLFDHAQAQREAEVEPDGVADDLARKAVAGVGGLGGGCHAGPPIRPGLTRQAPPQVDGAGPAPGDQGRAGA